MDVTSLGTTVQRLLQAGLAQSTQRTYSAGKRKYLTYCQEAGVLSLPATEQKLIGFVAYAVNLGLKHQTVKCYLSAVRHLQVEWGARVESMPSLALVLRGTKREQAGTPKRTRLPITPGILGKLHEVWNRDHDHMMLWAASCPRFLWLSEIGRVVGTRRWRFRSGTTPDSQGRGRENPEAISVRSKTDPFRLGVTIHVGKTGSKLCPVAAVLSYLVVRGMGEGPLFRFRDGRALTRSALVSQLRKALSSAGFDPSKYAGHSFRIGAATTAAACGVPDCQ